MAQATADNADTDGAAGTGSGQPLPDNAKRPELASMLTPIAEFRLRKYEAWIGLWKVVCGTAVVGIAAAAFPFLSEFAKTQADAWKAEQQLAFERERNRLQIALEETKLNLQKLETRRKFIGEFSTAGFNQDIELRLRFAEYFSHVADDEDRPRWQSFRNELFGRREYIRVEIEKLREAMAVERAKDSPDEVSIAKSERRIRWYEAELGPVQTNESVTVARRARDESTPRRRLTIERLTSFFGQPAASIGNDCTAIDNQLLKSQLRTEKVGAMTVTMIAPAIDSLKQIFGDVERRDPSLKDAVGNLGSICVRRVRGTQRVSPHAFGTAIDFSIDGKVAIFGAPAPGEINDKLIALAGFFEQAGWIWGGRDAVADSVHFEVGADLFESWVSSGAIRSK